MPEEKNPQQIEFERARAERASPGPSLLTVESFVLAHFGEKGFDQFAAFVRWARNVKRVERATRSRWGELLTEFMNRPIGGRW